MSTLSLELQREAIKIIVGLLALSLFNIVLFERICGNVLAKKHLFDKYNGLLIYSFIYITLFVLFVCLLTR